MENALGMERRKNGASSGYLAKRKQVKMRGTGVPNKRVLFKMQGECGKFDGGGMRAEGKIGLARDQYQVWNTRPALVSVLPLALVMNSRTPFHL